MPNAVHSEEIHDQLSGMKPEEQEFISTLIRNLRHCTHENECYDQTEAVIVFLNRFNVFLPHDFLDMRPEHIDDGS